MKPEGFLGEEKTEKVCRSNEEWTLLDGFVAQESA
jgi:hypothetical protein